MSQSSEEHKVFQNFDDSLAKSSANSLVGLGTQLTGKVFNYFQDKNKASKAGEAYAQKYCDRYGKIRLFGMTQEMELDEVYTGVNFLDRLSINQKYGSQEVIEKQYRNSGKRRFQTGECKPINGGKVANENQYLYVLGSPGAGKSTFLRRVGLEALKGTEGNYNHDCIPVMIELKQFSQGKVDLISAIAEELAYFGFPDRKAATEHYLEKGKLLLLFDGLDEVPKEHFGEIQQQIDKLKTKYGNNRMILSCRVAAYNSAMTGFETVELADFNEKQIENFIHKWFSKEKDRQNKVAQECWSKLSQPEYKASLELAQTPLLLAFLCITYGEYEDFPALRHQLYAEALDILLRRWDAQKRGIKRDRIQDIYADWTINLELAFLAEMAYDFFSEDELFFSKEKILNYIEVFLSQSAGEAQNIDTEAVLEAIVIQQGILVERVRGIYSFSHLTLQEYLTAKHISQSDRRTEKLVREHLTEERWQEVFLLLAGMKDKADDLFLLMEQETHQLINTDKLQNLLVWVKKVTNPEDTDLKYLGKRALIVANANANAFAFANDFANAKDYAIAYANVIANAIAKANANVGGYANANANVYAKAMANLIAYDSGTGKNYAIANAYPYTVLIGKFAEYIEWSKTWQIYKIDFDNLIFQLKTLEQKIPEDNDSEEIKQQFVQELLNIWWDGFLTTREEMTLSQEEIETLEKYLYSNHLIIKCYAARNRVTQKTWSDIEARMLLPVDRFSS